MNPQAEEPAGASSIEETLNPDDLRELGEMFRTIIVPLPPSGSGRSEPLTPEFLLLILEGLHLTPVQTLAMYRDETKRAELVTQITERAKIMEEFDADIVTPPGYWNLVVKEPESPEEQALRLKREELGRRIETVLALVA